MPHDRKISVIGLGYVGLPVAVALAHTGPVLGFDVDTARITELQEGRDRTGEMDRHALSGADVRFTSTAHELGRADFHIIAVPTPIDDAKRPDLTQLLSATKTVGEQLKQGDIVVYESTVYPGATEEECVPVLEAVSGLRYGADFGVGYSPERINPGDKTHGFSSITKVVSANDPKTLDVVSRVYESVVKAGVHRATSIKVAEAAKVIENTQRDLNIALMNELALIFDRMNIDTQEVLAAAGTKWNFLPFTPGLVGGHCIGVDPYYLTHKATMTGYNPQVILAGRSINDGMGAFIATQTVKSLVQKGYNVKQSLVTVLGITFKENVPDLRNSRVIDIIRELEDYGIEVQVTDPFADVCEARSTYDVIVRPASELKRAHCVIFAVPHDAYVDEGWRFVSRLLREGEGVVVDIKGVLAREAAPHGVTIWRL